MGFFGSLKNILKQNTKQQQPRQEQEEQQQEHDISLTLGVSTGTLLNLRHPAGIWADQIIQIADDDLCQNIIVMGGIGAGKTTRVINPLLYQLLTMGGYGGLIFDIKSDFKETVFSFCREMGRPSDSVKVIGIGNLRTNLLKGLTPAQASSFLQSTFYLTGGTTSDSFWIQSATDLVKNTLGILSFLGDKYYTLDYLYRYIFIDSQRETINAEIQKILTDETLEEREEIKLQGYLSYYNNVFLQMDNKVQTSITGTLSTILNPFQELELIETFSDNEQPYDLTNILYGDVVLLDLPLAKWGIAGKVIYTLIKLRFFNLLQERQFNKSLPQHYVYFICDEYQEIISASKMGLSDLTFWDKSRSAKCIGIISTQSVSAFRSVIGNTDIADTILSNFRQKIFFRTEDINTINLINQLTGKTEVVRYSNSTSTGASKKNTDFFEEHNNTNYSFNANVIDKPLIDANLITTIDANHAIALLNIEGGRADDIIGLCPKYPTC